MINNSVLLFRLIFAAVVGVLLYYLAPILTPFVIAILLAYMGNPTVTRLERLHVPRVASIALLFILFFIIVLAMFLILIPSLQTQIGTFNKNFPQYLAWLHKKLATFANGMFNFDMDAIKDQLMQQWQGVGKELGAVLAYAGSHVVNWAIDIVLVPVVTFYLLRDWDDILWRIERVMPVATRKHAVPLAREIDDTLASFLRGQLSVMGAQAIFYSIALLVLGLDLALPIAFLAGIGTFIPYLGFIVGILTASVATLLQFQDASHLLWVLGIFVVGQALEAMVLTPYLVGDRIGLHPVMVIFAIMAGGELFGFFGILLALPVAAAAMVWFRHFHARYKANDTA